MGLALLFSGVAYSATQGAKCANSINKGASKVAKAYAGDAAACIKNAGKGKLGTQTVEECITSDPKGKVAKAVSKIKTSDCVGAPPVPAIPDLVTDTAAIDDIMLAKDLGLIEAVFGPDLDAVVIDAKDPNRANAKAEAKCQAAVAKALGKCQDAKLSSFNACKKDLLKNWDPNTPLGLQDACMGTGTTPPGNSIPDGKGKIAKKCADFGLVKKCGSPVDPDVLFPGCAPGVTKECLDQKVECGVCWALNALDGLDRNCDEFDGDPNGSCSTTWLGFTGKPIGYHRKPFDVRKFCVGGTNDPNACEDHGDCPPGWPDARCTPLANFLITTAFDPPFRQLGPFPLIGHTSTDCGVVDPSTGVATCDCVLEDVEPVLLPSVGFLCFQAISDCPSGQIDCDGGTPMDIDMISNHDVGEDLQDPNLLDLGLFCGAPDPNTGNQQCEAACEVYCAGLEPPGSYTLLVSDCNGYCQGGPNEDLPCDSNEECPDSSCSGPDPSASVHSGECQCQCVQVGGNPSGAGGMYCQVGVKIVVESAAPCDGTDVTSVVGERCSLVTTERAHSVILNANRQIGTEISGGVMTGIRPDCDELAADEAVISTVGHRIFLDSDITDQESATTSMTGTQ
jgi:hypothetical protein